MDANCFVNPGGSCTRGVDFYEDSVEEGDHGEHYFSIWTDGTITIKDQESKGSLSEESDGKLSFKKNKEKWLYFDVSQHNKKHGSTFGSGKKHFLLTSGVYSSQRSSMRIAYQVEKYRFGWDQATNEFMRFSECHPIDAKLGKSETLDLGTSDPLYNSLSTSTVCDPILVKALGAASGLTKAPQFAQSNGGRMLTRAEGKNYFAKMKETYIFRQNSKGQARSGTSYMTPPAPYTAYPINGLTT